MLYELVGEINYNIIADRRGGKGGERGGGCIRTVNVVFLSKGIITFFLLTVLCENSRRIKSVKNNQEITASKFYFLSTRKCFLYASAEKVASCHLKIIT